MAFQSVPDTIEITTRYSRAGSFWGTNTFHFQDGDGPPTTERVHELVDLITAWLISELAPLYSDEVSVTDVTGRSLHSEFGPYWSESVSIFGTIASPALPPNVTIAVTRFSGVTGRSNRGRIYFCGIPENMPSGKHLTAPTQALIIAALELLLVDPALASFNHVIVSRWEDGVKRTTGVTRGVEGYRFADSRVDSMKTRLVD